MELASMELAQEGEDLSEEAGGMDVRLHFTSRKVVTDLFEALGDRRRSSDSMFCERR